MRGRALEARGSADGVATGTTSNQTASDSRANGDCLALLNLSQQIVQVVSKSERRIATFSRVRTHDTLVGDLSF
jgi:hypothetical protein